MDLQRQQRASLLLQSSSSTVLATAALPSSLHLPSSHLSGNSFPTAATKPPLLGLARSSSTTPVNPASSASPATQQSHLELLERLTTQNSATASAGKEMKTIREQLSSQIEPEAQEVIIPLSSLEKLEVPVKELTISQKRNIRRQDYLTKVSERNDVPFFATLAAAFLVPPICILGIAVATGYVDLFP
ncbi:unnamed protein product [Sphagnum jensenii]|uniref:Chlororespiratory reduction 3 n=1 Tax=Sphagnum jensenii TaxID=128206 RepID=A0ABP1AZV2_9BRYO